MRSIQALARLVVLVGAIVVVNTPVTSVRAGESCQDDPCPECQNPLYWMQANMECQNRGGARDMCYTTENPVEGCCDHVGTICQDEDPEYNCANMDGANSCAGY